MGNWAFSGRSVFLILLTDTSGQTGFEFKKYRNRKIAIFTLAEKSHVLKRG